MATELASTVLQVPILQQRQHNVSNVPLANSLLRVPLHAHHAKPATLLSQEENARHGNLYLILVMQGNLLKLGTLLALLATTDNPHLEAAYALTVRPTLSPPKDLRVNLVQRENLPLPDPAAALPAQTDLQVLQEKIVKHAPSIHFRSAELLAKIALQAPLLQPVPRLAQDVRMVNLANPAALAHYGMNLLIL